MFAVPGLNSPWHGRIDSEGSRVGVSETSRRDWVNRLTLPGKRRKDGKVKEKDEKALSTQAALFSFDQNKNLGDCRARIKAEQTPNNLNATNLIGMAN